jgi:hypothetical protein
MEDDVGFYKKVKQALAQKEKEEGGFSANSAEYDQRGNLDLSYVPFISIFATYRKVVRRIYDT